MRLRSPVARSRSASGTCSVAGSGDRRSEVAPGECSRREISRAMTVVGRGGAAGRRGARRKGASPSDAYGSIAGRARVHRRSICAVRGRIVTGVRSVVARTHSIARAAPQCATAATLPVPCVIRSVGRTISAVCATTVAATRPTAAAGLGAARPQIESHRGRCQNESPRHTRLAEHACSLLTRQKNEQLPAFIMRTA